MKAIICSELGNADRLKLGEIPDPDPAADEILINVRAASLNFPDTLTVAGTYQFRPELPFVPGGEAAGVVAAVGQQVKEFKPGDRVASVGISGAFAEKRCCKAQDVTAIPDGMPFEIASGFLVTYGTSYYALKQCAGLKQDETLLVLGAAGGVGLAAVDLGCAMGARVIAAASSEQKLDIACDAGAVERVNYSAGNLKEQVKSLTGGQGVDVVYDPVGGELAEAALRATGWNGRFLVVGFASGEIPRIPLNLTLLKNNSIRGVFYGAWAQRDPGGYQENIAELFSLYEQEKLHPLTSQQFRLEQFREAFSMLTERRALGKVIFNLAS